MENDNNNQDQKEENPYKPGVNPFTNQAMPAQPPPSSFNPPGEIKPPVNQQPADVKPIKPASKLDFKVIFLYILLIGIGAILAKYALDFFIQKPSASSSSSSQNAAKKSGIGSLIKFSPGKQQTSAAGTVNEDKKGNLPFIALKKKINQTVNPYILSGIFFSGERNYCIINDKVLEEGDSIESAKVVRISTDEVELQLNEKTLKLNLRGR